MHTSHILGFFAVAVNFSIGDCSAQEIQPHNFESFYLLPGFMKVPPTHGFESYAPHLFPQFLSHQSMAFSYASTHVVGFLNFNAAIFSYLQRELCRHFILFLKFSCSFPSLFFLLSTPACVTSMLTRARFTKAVVSSWANKVTRLQSRLCFRSLQALLITSLHSTRLFFSWALKKDLFGKEPKKLLGSSQSRVSYTYTNFNRYLSKLSLKSSKELL